MEGSEHRLCSHKAWGGGAERGSAPVTPEEGGTLENRICDIHIRVTEQEKRRMEARAKRAGIGLSAYLRRVGIGENLGQPTPAELFDNLEEGVGPGHHEDLGHQG